MRRASLRTALSAERRCCDTYRPAAAGIVGHGDEERNEGNNHCETGEDDLDRSASFTPTDSSLHPHRMPDVAPARRAHSGSYGTRFGPSVTDPGSFKPGPTHVVTLPARYIFTYPFQATRAGPPSGRGEIHRPRDLPMQSPSRDRTRASASTVNTPDRSRLRTCSMAQSSVLKEALKRHLEMRTRTPRAHSLRASPSLAPPHRISS